VQADHPAKAAESRDWNHPTTLAMLTWLVTATRNRPARRETELWRMRKSGRELRCVAVYLPTGIDLRLLEGADFQRTRLVPDKYMAERLSAEWASQLQGVGWSRASDHTSTDAAVRTSVD
jgi:hypothetical protein